MRAFLRVLILLACAPLAAAESEFDKLQSTPESAKVMKVGINKLKSYFKAAVAVDSGKTRQISKRDKAMREFLTWLAATGEELGVDLRGKPEVVVEMFDVARVDTLSSKIARGKIDYVKVPEVRGMKRLEYATLLPERYTPKSKDNTRYPLVICMHERVINPKHPAFRGNKDPAERSRVAIHNNWLNTPASNRAVIVAPTGGPNGFMWVKRPGDDLQQLMRTLGIGLSNFRTDWNRVFVDLSGPALRVACEQTMMFAGFILRDREGQNKLPVPEEELFMLENLNGTPFLYIADEAQWDKVGKPLSEKLAEFYKKAGKPENLVVIKDKRDGNGALKGDPAVVDKFLAQHARPAARDSFTWRFFSSDMVNPVPVIVGLAMYDYDPNQPLEKTAGTIKYKASLESETVKDKDGNDTKVFYNLIDLAITEAEGITLLFYDGMVDLSKPVTVRINGKINVDKARVERDWGRFVSDVLPLRFFMIPVVGSLNCEFEHKPQYVAPKKEEPSGAGSDAGAANATDSSDK